jgi:hypothetical protein
VVESRRSSTELTRVTLPGVNSRRGCHATISII